MQQEIHHLLTEEEREGIFGHTSAEYGKKIRQLGSARTPFSNLTLPVFCRYDTYLRLCNVCIPLTITELELGNKWEKKREKDCIDTYVIKLFNWDELILHANYLFLLVI